MKTEEEIRNDERFGNRRKMAFWALYVVIAVTLAMLFKILYVPAAEAGIYRDILNWGLTLFGSIILAYIGAASIEQINTPVVGKNTNVVIKDDEKIVAIPPAPKIPGGTSEKKS